MKQALLESMGEEGLNKAYIYASSYMWSSSEKVRKNGKAKAVRFETLDKICEVLDCQPGDILEHQK